MQIISFNLLMISAVIIIFKNELYGCGCQKINKNI